MKFFISDSNSEMQLTLLFTLIFPYTLKKNPNVFLTDIENLPNKKLSIF